jgi:protein TonB
MSLLVKILLPAFMILSIFANAQNAEPLGTDKPLDVPKEYFTAVDNMPVFPGCEMLTNKDDRFNCTEQQFIQYIEQHIIYPKQALEMRCEGIVMISFIVDEEGLLNNIEVVRDQTPGCGLKEEALDIINSFNNTGIRWKPGQHNGEIVKVKMMVPIKFGTEAYKGSYKKKKKK